MRLAAWFLLVPLTQVFSQTAFKILRYNEDYTYLAADTARKNGYDHFKLRQVGKRTYVSFGGEVRYLIQNFINEDWGEIPVPEYTAFYSRFLLHADIHVGKAVRGFIQVNSTFANGRVTPLRSIDENRLAVHQAFLDLKATSFLLLRMGRQELLYGSQRLISVREGPNNRLSFDATKVIFQKNKISSDLFYAKPVAIRVGVVDDLFQRNQQLWGSYTVINLIPIVKNIDLYYLGYQRNSARFDAGIAREIRHSFGFRWWGKVNQWDYDFEALYQTGKFGKSQINAWTASLNVSYRITSFQKDLTLGLKTEAISGDRNLSDNELNTFNPLFPRGAYFGLAALIGPSNLMDVHPSLKLELNPTTTVSLDYDLFWRQTVTDGIYGPNGFLIYSGRDTSARYIGDQLGINLECTPNRHLTVVPEFTWFNAGPYLRQAGNGKDVFFSAITIQYKY